ncbi:FtsX-like permease family protein [Bifidobacterium breve]|uniref:FtsX-like permease family protein n=1 Tax=Bifidobacterium breve TaxID=1685 RepID=A0AAW4U6N4_BIFBR|nr:FtsX-like permease family protein [Bifidobacterium breve]MCB8548053.1 FtsX-like permease family protein [Bifidobacterium sp. MSK23_125]MCB8554949.1 FtsX-like permease family protein [Bifidobacterium sp. MSK23_139]MBU9891220.1 FtsX-like permease family protein [Bifidobacterium breve]MBV3240787.1 FtsX-like permease family protein [Bifidobacterium breve]MBV3254681.1 FtsX-like permease family protein [Bifidobacterium breve]
MFSITVKLMKKSARMLIPAGIAILIGTAFIAATFLFGNAMNDSLARQTTAQLGGANYVISVDSSEGLNEQERNDIYTRTVNDFQLDRIRATEGVKDVRVESSSSVTVANGDKHASSYAITTAAQRDLLPVSIIQGGQPVDSNEIALTKSVADQLGVKVGDSVTVNSRTAQAVASTGYGSAGNDTAADSGMTVRVVGITEDPNGAYAYYGGASVLSDNVITAMNGIDDFGKLNVYLVYLDIDDADQPSADATVKQIDKLLPKHFTVQSRAAMEEESIKSVSKGDTSITTIFLLSFGILAMLVAALVIANTFQVLVAQRRRTLALLRTIGANKGQLYVSVLFEAGLLGLIASMLGVGLGIGLMAALCQSGLMKATGMTMRLVLSWPAFVVPIAFGVVMTVIASLGSARSATAVTPLEALRPIELTDTRRAGKIRAILAGLLVLVGIGLAAFSAWQMNEKIAGHDSLADKQYPMVLLAAIAGCALIFLGLVLSAAFWLPVLMRGVGALVAFAGPSAKVAHANIQKNPRRVAATGAALLIGVTLVSTIATGAASAKQTMNEALTTRYSVDMIAASADMTSKQADEVAKIKGIKDSIYAPTRMMSMKDANGKDLNVLIVGVDGVDALRKVVRADLSGVTISGDSVLMPKYSAATGKDIPLGKSVTFTSDVSGSQTGTADAAASDTENDGGQSDGVQTLTLAPQKVDYRRISANYAAVAFVDAGHFTNGDVKANGHIMLMRIDAESAGTTLNDIFTNVQNAFSASADIDVSGPVAERTQWETMINGMMALLVGLIAVAVLIALVGVANTLSLSVIERTRESATLRAIGMTRGQLRRSLAVEALLLSLVSGVVGVALGTLFGWLGSYMVFSLYGDTVFPFEWTTNGAVLGVAALAALLASVAPARRAVKTPPVEALAEA